MLKKLKITQKILLPFAALILVLIAAFSYLIVTLELSREDLVRNIQSTRSLISYVDQLSSFEHEVEQTIISYSLDHRPRDLHRLQQISIKKSELLDGMSALIPAGQARAMFSTYAETRDQTDAAQTRLITAIQRGDAVASDLELKKWLLLRRNLNASLSDIVAYATYFLDSNSALLQSLLERTLVIYLFMIAISGLLLAFIYFYLRKFIIRPIVQLTSGARGVVDENRPLRLEYEHQDEIGTLHQTLNAMVTKLQASHDEAWRVAHRDPLTNLHNRHSIEEKFQSFLAESLDHNEQVALLFLDLDRFKNVNDTLGHYVGDSILREVALRYSSLMPERHVIARLGGDEFAILLSVANENEAGIAAQKLIEILRKPFIMEDHRIHLGTSVGIAISPSDGDTFDSLLKHADIALYRAKEAGRNRFRFFDPRMNLQAYARFSLENDLRTAVERKELSYYYQPIVDAERRVVAAEALIRWQHPHLGLLHPFDFIDIAEESGLTVQIGEWGLENIPLMLDPKCPKIAINISPRQFREKDFLERVERAGERLDRKGHRLELEITEGTAMGNAEMSEERLRDIRECGITVSIDDFGTGYSSLSYLKNFPINRLKIDKSFIRYCTENDQDASIVKAIMNMAYSLNLEVTAEGVETEDQFEFLKNLGCNAFQGYYISRPLSGNEFSAWLETQEIHLAPAPLHS